MASSDEEPKFVWVREGKELHPAFLLGSDLASQNKAEIQWSTTGDRKIVDLSLVVSELPSRRRSSKKTKEICSSATTVAAKKIKVEDRSSLVPSPPLADTSTTDTKPPAVVSPTQFSDVSDTISSPTHISSEEEEDDVKEILPHVKKESEWSRIVRIKKEEVDAAYENQQQQEESTATKTQRLSPERAARKQQMVQALTDPRTQQGRHVFRRGCHPRCISTVLGGTGTEACALVRNPPPGQKPLFVQAGDSYIAGHCIWNPWAPKFPGDQGLVDATFLKPNQDAYHLFTSCATEPFEPHYHGKDARGKYMYLGKYVRLYPESDDDSVVVDLKYQDLGDQCKVFRANYYRKKNKTAHWYDPTNNDMPQTASAQDLTPAHYEQARLLVGMTEDEWQSIDVSKRTTAAWVEMLIEKQCLIRLVPVKFQGYDEELYKALVYIGATNGRVDLDANIV